MNNVFLDTLPPFLKQDPNILNLANSIISQLNFNIDEIAKNIIYRNIDNLDEKVLDLLACDLHIDWYDFRYDIEAKRETVKNSVKVHKYLGTKFAVQTALSNIYPNSKIEEWFEYDGDPFMFRVVIDISKRGFDLNIANVAIKNIDFYKNFRSKLETFVFKVNVKTNVFCGAFLTSNYKKETIIAETYPNPLNKNIYLGSVLSANYKKEGIYFE